MNQMLVQIEPGYGRALAGLKRVLEQRNSLLKKIAAGEEAQDVLEAWDQELVRISGEVVEARAAAVLEMQPEVAAYHAEIAAGELLAASPPPTALFAGQNLLTIGAYRALRRLKLHNVIALVGFDDFLLADLLEPGITVVAQDAAALGRAAAEQLFRRIDGDRSPSVHAVISTQLIARGSGELKP